jgi:beta-glucosidase
VGAQEDIESGVEISKNADVAIVFVKADSGEKVLDLENSRGDREDLNVWHKGNELIEKIAKVNENVIVVINAPSVVNVPWIDKVKGVLFSGFAGAEGGHAIADILFGNENPSGHLPYVWGKEDDYFTKIKLKNTTIQENGKTFEEEYRYNGIDSAGLQDNKPGYDKEQYNYTEGLYIGQRWFNKQNIKPVFPFGFGLSYTTFNYSDLKVNMKKEGLICEFKIKNTGSFKGKAVPMLFLSFPDSIGDYPKYIFKGYEKVDLKPLEEKEVKIIVDDHALSYFNVEKNDYVRINDGKIKVYIAENGDPNEEAKLTAEVSTVGNKSSLLIIFNVCGAVIGLLVIFLVFCLIQF